MKKLTFVLTLFLLFTIEAEIRTKNEYPKKPTFKPGELPIGRLGYPIGTYLTIEGQRKNGIKTGVRTFKVLKINGKVTKTPTSIWIDNVDLPPNKICILKGYETFRTLGQPPAIGKWARENGKDVTVPQAGWQIQFYFVALSIVTPDGLKIRKKQ